MDAYCSQKIKITIKTVGTLILIIFYSSLVDFYYIGPYIHNTLSEIRFLANTNSVTAKSVQKIFLEINAMVYDTISLFNGFNRSMTKDMKTHLSKDIIYNERIFFNLRGVPNSKEIMEMCRDYSGGKKYKEIIESETIKSKIKTDVKVFEQPKYGDEVKVEKNEVGIFKFLKFKKKVKKNIFLDEPINIEDFSEFKNDYEESIEKIKNLTTEGESNIKKDDNDIIEVFDFINNVTNTDKNKQTNLKELSFWMDTEENTENNKELKDINNLSNKDEELTFEFDFEIDEKKKSDKLDDKKIKETKKNEEKAKKEIKNNEPIFDFNKNLNNMNNSTNKIKKIINNNNNDNKKIKEEIKENQLLIDFDFNEENKKESTKKIDKGKNNEIPNKNNNNNNNNLFDFSKFGNNNNTNNNNINNKISQNTKSINKNDHKINDNKTTNQLIDFFNFPKTNTNANENEKAKTSIQKNEKNQSLIGDDQEKDKDNIPNLITNDKNSKNNLFNFDNFKAMNNNNNKNKNSANTNNNLNLNTFDFTALHKQETYNNNLPNQFQMKKSNDLNQKSTNIKDNSMDNNKNYNTNIGFNFNNANFSNPKNNINNIQNQIKNISNNNLTQNKINNLNNNQNQNNKNNTNNLNELLSNFNFGTQNQSNNNMMTQFIPPFPNSTNNNISKSNSSKLNNSTNFNFANFNLNNNNNNQLSLFQKNSEEINIELREQICFYYKFKSGNKIINAINQGYLGLSTEKEINNSKDFNITFKSQKFKNPQYIQNKFDSKMVKIDDLNYKIHFNNLKKSEKLLEYVINPNILAKNRIIEPFIKGENNILRFGFMYNNKLKKEIDKIDINILYKNMISNNNMIKSDGNITNNNNNQIIVTYKGKVNEAKIEYPININVFALVSQITITVNLEKDIISEIDVDIRDNSNQRLLVAKKNSQINYEFT